MLWTCPKCKSKLVIWYTDDKSKCESCSYVDDDEKFVNKRKEKK